LIFTDFDFDCPNNTTLSVMTYPFNAARNSSIGLDRVHWAALFVNVNYRPFLEKRFPNSQWYWVAQGLEVNDGGYALAIIPIIPGNRGDIDRWNKAHELMQQTNLLWYSQCPIQWPVIFQSLQSAYPIAQTDPFLESIYWEKTAAYYYKKVDFKNCINAYLQALNHGYPTAGLCFKLGDLLLALKDPKDAMKLFRDATKAPLDLTKASSELFQLEQRFSSGQ
jgi:tetratricopeptide (TPR) repeat protein